MAAHTEQAPSTDKKDIVMYSNIEYNCLCHKDQSRISKFVGVIASIFRVQLIAILPLMQFIKILLRCILSHNSLFFNCFFLVLYNFQKQPSRKKEMTV